MDIKNMPIPTRKNGRPKIARNQLLSVLMNGLAIKSL
jgi:hypothetical protein